MKKVISCLCFFAFANFANAYEKQKHNPPVSLALTHILPSSFVVPSGVFYLGTSAGFGLFDSLELTTDLYLDLEMAYNLGLKYSFIHGYDLGFAVYFSYSGQTLQTVNSLGAVIGTQTYSAMIPGFVFSYRIAHSLTGNLGANNVSRSPTLGASDLQAKSGYIRGSTMNKEFTIGINPMLSVSVGASYDFTFNYWGTGGTFHFSSFNLGAHYYAGVATGQVMPIISGSYVSQF